MSEFDPSNGIRTGCRVRIADDYHWARGAVGIVAEPGDEVTDLTGGWSDARRSVAGADQELTFVWVQFDEPQFDADGDGPYSAAEIDERFLRLLR